MSSTFAATLARAKKYILNTRLLGRLSAPECLIERLTDDILVDQVFQYLDIEDILCLRRTSLLFFTLTSEPVVWRRTLRRLHQRRIPIPALPPTPRYNIDSITSHEVEQLILRALSIDKNWRSAEPKLYSIQHSPANPNPEEQANVVEMVTLPGGHYFVTCERRLDELTQRSCFSINVYGMDDESGLIVKLGMMQLLRGKDRAFNLQAKYMTINEEKSLVIGWAIRDYTHPEHAAFENLDHPDGLSGRAEVYFPMRYRFETWRMKLEALERTMESDRSPADVTRLSAEFGSPFIRLHSLYHRGWTIGSVCMDECQGRPLLAMTIKPNIIVVKDLNNGAESRWTCASVIVPPVAPVNSAAQPTYFMFPTSNPPPMRSREIVKIKILPTQATIVVLRRCDGGDKRQPHYTMELYNIPDFWKPAKMWRRHQSPTSLGARTSRPPLWGPLESASMNDGYFDDFEVSDHGFASVHDASLFPVLSRDVRPPPISIFGRTRAPSIEGLMHMSIWPLRVSSLDNLSLHTPTKPAPALPLPQLRYTLTEARYQSYQAFEDADHNLSVHVLPGSYRALVYITPGSDTSDAPPITALYSYVSPEARALRGNLSPIEAEEEEEKQIAEARRPATRDRSLVAINLPRHVASLLMQGVTAITWDETIGRLCFSTVRSCKVYVLDFAMCPRADRYDILPTRLPPRNPPSFEGEPMQL